MSFVLLNLLRKSMTFCCVDVCGFWNENYVAMLEIKKI